MNVVNEKNVHPIFSRSDVLKCIYTDWLNSYTLWYSCRDDI